MNHLKGILGDAAAVALHKLRSFVASNVALHVRPREIAMHLRRGDDTDMIQATFQLEALDEERRTLAFKTSAGTWQLQSLSCDRAVKEVLIEKGDTAGALIALDLQQGAKSWDGAEVNALLRAESLKSAPSLSDKLFVAPEFLPAIVGSDAISQVAEQAAISSMRLSSAEGNSIDIAGVPSDPRDSLDIGTGMLQLIVLPTTSLFDSSNSGILLAGDSKEVSSQKKKAIIQVVERMFAFLSNWFGHPSGARVAVVLSENSGLMPSVGPCIVVPPAWFDHGAALADREMYICRQLASTWWGVGCRISSPIGTQVAHAISAAAALQWLAETGKTAQRNRVLEAFMEHSAKLKGRTSLQPIDWESTPAPGMTLALGLDEALGKGARMQTALQTLTNKCWGKLVHPNAVLRSLEESGVESSWR